MERFISTEFERFAFASPIIYAGLLTTVWIARSMGWTRPIDTTFHNRNMIFQSCLLLGCVDYKYIVAQKSSGFEWTDFLGISKFGAENHRENIWNVQPALLLFIASKIFEWFDTVLLLVNRKKIIPLHLWHHATIGLAFYTGYFSDSVFWIGGLNSFIHIIMYAHYSNIKGVRRFAKYLTQLQIIQLFGGVAMNWISYNNAIDSIDPAKYQRYAQINGMICMSYGLMFLQLYTSKYSGEKPPKPNVSKPEKYVIIDDVSYDITNFKHPGGTVINYMSNGQNATEAFREFHNRSTRAETVLRSLPHKPVETRHSTDREILDDFAIFRKRLIDDGFFKPDIPMVVYRIIEQMAIFSAGVYFLQTNVWISILCMGMFRARSGWIQHEGGHNSLTGTIWIDKLIQDIFIGFGLHVTGSLWNKMHNKHHTTPQKSKYDIDLDTTPLVAFYDTAVESNRRKAFSKWWLKYQMYTFLPITSGIFVPLLWITVLHPRQAICNGEFRQLGVMIASHVVPMWIFCYNDYSLLQSVGVHCASTWFSNMYLFGHFSLSHTFCSIVEENDNPSWVRYATEHSVEIAVGNPAVDWVMGYLNYQVIHHLFPSMPQHRGPEVSLLWTEFCTKHSIVYTKIGYFEAWYRMFQNLNRVGEAYQKKHKIH